MKKTLIIFICLLLTAKNTSISSQCIDDFFICRPSGVGPDGITFVVHSNYKGIDYAIENGENILLTINGGYFDHYWPKKKPIFYVKRIDINTYLIVDSGFIDFSKEYKKNNHFDNATHLDSLATCTYENGLSIELIIGNNPNPLIFYPCYYACKVVNTLPYSICTPNIK